MFQFVRGIALVAAILLGCGASFAEENVRAAQYVMTGCRAIGEPRTAWSMPFCGVGALELSKRSPFLAACASPKV